LCGEDPINYLGPKGLSRTVADPGNVPGYGRPACPFLITWVFTISSWTCPFLAVRGVTDVGYAPVSGNSSTGGWFGILGGTHEKDCVLFMSRLTNKFGFTLQDGNRVMEHTRFLLLTRSTSAEDCCLRIEREARKIAECTSYTPCVLLSFSPPPLFPTHRATTRSNEGRRMDLRTSFQSLC